MKRISCILLVGILFINACDFSSKPNRIEVNLNLTIAEKELSKSDNEFTFKLMQKISNMEDGNVFISPLSVSFAFGMVYNGTAGETKNEIAELLALSEFSSEEINNYYQKMIELLPKLDDKVKFKIANSIWIRDGFPVEDTFLEMNKKYFSAEIDNLDFNNAKSLDIINDWASDATNGKINKILEEIPGDIIMYLINALYFKGDWTNKFKKSNTKEDDFHWKNGSTRTVSMMVQEDKFDYLENNDIQMIDLPYGDEKFSMSIILPKENVAIDEYLQNLTSNDWNNLINNCTGHTVEIYLPKFELEYKIELISALKALGLNAPFNAQLADFTPMSQEYGHSLEISEVKHKTYLKVDEEGSEAAAVTSIGIKCTSVGPGSSVVMKVDHPFILAIRERENGTILFIGKIMELGE